MLQTRKSATGITVSRLFIASAMKNSPFSSNLESVYSSNPSGENFTG